MAWKNGSRTGGIRTKDLWGGFWPNCYEFEIALHAFGVASGLNFTISIRTRCLSRGFWPNKCDFQSALGTFRMASGLNVTTFNQH